MLQKGVFTVDEVAGAFTAEFLDEGKVRTWLFRKLNPAGPRCPHCGEGVLPGKGAATFWNGGRVCCKKCRAYFTASTGTFIAGAALSPRELFLLALLLGFEVPAAEIAEILGRTEETVRFWRTKLAVASELAEPLSPPGSPAGSDSPPGDQGAARQGEGILYVVPTAEDAAELARRIAPQRVPVYELGSVDPTEFLEVLDRDVLQGNRAEGEPPPRGVFSLVDPEKEKAAEIAEEEAGITSRGVPFRTVPSFGPFCSSLCELLEERGEGLDPFPEGFQVRTAGGSNGK